MKRKIKNALIGCSAAVSFVAFVGAASTPESPDFTWDRLPALVLIMAASAIWLMIIAKANAPTEGHR